MPGVLSGVGGLKVDPSGSETSPAAVSAPKAMGSSSSAPAEGPTQLEDKYYPEPWRKRLPKCAKSGS